MNRESRGTRRPRSLLIAVIGVATASFVESQSGCAMEADSRDPDQEGQPYDDEPEAESGQIGSSQQALTVSNTELSKLRIKLPFPPGNLMVPIEKIPIPVGNLMATPPIEVIRADVAQATLATESALVAPVALDEVAR